MSGILEVTNQKGTSFKLGTEQAKDLSKNQVYQVKKGQIFQYSSIDKNEGLHSGHYKVYFTVGIPFGNRPEGVHTWYVYPADVAV